MMHGQKNIKSYHVNIAATFLYWSGFFCNWI